MTQLAVESRRLCRQIADQLRGLIRSSEFPVSRRLPSGREMAALTVRGMRKA
jgi:DNA-binding FadR family transcriptional regulator